MAGGDKILDLSSIDFTPKMIKASFLCNLIGIYILDNKLIDKQSVLS
jgi:hypothetical protein